MNKALIIGLVVLGVGLIIGAVILWKSQSGKDGAGKVVNYTAQATQDTQDGKGGKGDWGEGQKNHVMFIIASSLLKTQTKIAHIKQPIAEFLERINACLKCIVKNFAEKYDYSYVMERISSVGKDKKFDNWFKHLYGTCACNDKLGKLLTELLKKYWTGEAVSHCPDTADEVTSCIKRISVRSFSSQGAVDTLYQQLEECVGRACPELLSKVDPKT